MLPLATKNPVNIFASKMNLLLLFTYSDIDKAAKYGERLLVDVDDFLPGHRRELFFMLGNIYFLNKQFSKAKSFYRNCLKLAPKPKLEAQILNNLAFTSWVHL